VIELEQQ
jgi:hypothetical protein